jgi:hypothetical protein
MVVLKMGVLQTIFPGWLGNAILLISTSASRVARITHVSHWCPVKIPS